MCDVVDGVVVLVVVVCFLSGCLISVERVLVSLNGVVGV